MPLPSPIKPQWFQILLALSERDLHGFGIQRAVLDQTNGTMHLWPAMLYRSLDSLAEENLIRPVDGPATEAEDERKQYYSLTARGRKQLGQEVELMAGWVATARSRP